MAPKAPAIYQIKITLRHVRPPVTRRIQVKPDTKLGALHEIVQIVMGWTNSHMHAFRKGHVQYGEPNDDFGFDVIDERKVRLDSLVNEGGTLVYEYDFGDGWEHDLKVEKVIPAEAKTHYPPASPANAIARPKTAAARGDTKICSKPWPIPRTKNMKPCANGSAATSTPRSSTSTKSTRDCATSSSMRRAAKPEEHDRAGAALLGAVPRVRP